MIDARGSRTGGMGMPVGRIGGGAGLVGLLVFLAVQLLGGSGAAFDVDSGLGGGASVPGQAEGIPPSEDPERDLNDFSTYVFTDAQKTWGQTFSEAGRRYEDAQLVLYRDGVSTACGSASSAVGPFYCPGDRRVYLDLSFYGELANRLGAGGDFAWAYVIAHEMGHHVQQLLGTSEEVRRLQSEDRDAANQLSVRTELQADCYAGVWAHTVFEQGDVEKGDVREALTAAAAIGDDRLQREATGTVNPDSFTHGTSEQRRAWFETGYEGGDPDACDTFSPDDV